VIYAVLLTGLKSDDHFTQATINLPFPYFQLQGLLLVGINPVLEELLMRGYFFEILRKKWNVVIALLITLVFSAILHFRFDVGVVHILIMQTIFTFLYLYGGILSSTLVHALSNYYYVYFVNLD
jgi:membrane protease YdiL (CAAX protease family)